VICQRGAELAPSIRVCVEGINAVVLRSDENDVMGALASDRNVWNIERLRVNPAVNRVRKQLAEGGLIYVGGCQNRFGAVCAGASVIVVLCQDRGFAPKKPQA